MIRFDFELKGGRGLEKQLRELGPKLAGNVVRTAARNAMKPVEDAMRELAPQRDVPGLIGGTLKESIIRTTKWYRTSGVVMVFVGVAKEGAKKAIGLRGKQVIYANPTNYAHLLEFGHRIAVGGTLKRKGHPKSGGGTVAGFVAPRPFMEVALNAYSGVVVDRFRAELVKGLIRAVKRIERDTAGK